MWCGLLYRIFQLVKVSFCHPRPKLAFCFFTGSDHMQQVDKGYIRTHQFHSLFDCDLRVQREIYRDQYFIDRSWHAIFLESRPVGLTLD
jgi:hypothetical protein